MRTRQLGFTDLHLSVLGLGSFALGGPHWKASWGPQSDEDSVDAIVRAVELGVNWIDTAPVYGYGHSEDVVGRRSLVTSTAVSMISWIASSPVSSGIRPL